ncbi:MAG: hypothetical protein AAF830_02985 [Pseudomonadota bacterium]
MLRKKSLFAIAAAAATALAATAQAKIEIVLDEVGNDLVFTFNGTLDLTGMMRIDESQEENRSGLGARFGSILSFPDGSLIDTYGAPSLDAFGGRNSGPEAGISTGDAFGIFGDDVFGLPTGYVSGDFISGTMMIENADFSTFSIVPGVYTRTFANGSGFVLLAGDVQAVPLPAGAVLAAPVVGAMVLRRRKKA